MNVSPRERLYALAAEAAIPNRWRWTHWIERPTHEPGAGVWREVEEWARDCLGDGNLLLHGPPGTGKTTLVAYLVHRYLESQAVLDFEEVDGAYWLHVGDFVRRAKRLLKTDRVDELDRILGLAQTTWVLVLDDLGAERPSEFVRDLLADIIEARYDEDRGSTIVTSNYTPDELAERLGGGDPIVGDRLVGRLLERAFQLRFDGVDRRVPEAA